MEIERLKAKLQSAKKQLQDKDILIRELRQVIHDLESSNQEILKENIRLHNQV
jgi:hypothetical protein